jgi:DNA-binding MarR family transcriptional regulator
MGRHSPLWTALRSKARNRYDCILQLLLNALITFIVCFDEKPTVPMLKQSLTYQLASIAEDGIGNAGRIFESRFGWTVYEIRVLRLVRDNPGITFTQLAQLTKFERTATSRMLSRLVKAKLVDRMNSALDARQFTLTVTPDGQELCDRADPISLELEALMLEPLSQAEREVLRAMLTKVLTWVRGDYAQKVGERFSEVQSVPPGRGTRRSAP